ncbi:MAG: HDOD domain-containing protein [Burkholderiaceae bacterium]
MQNSSSAPERALGNPRDAFLQKLDKEIDLPAMGSAVAHVVQLASSDDQAVQDLAYYVLSDVALTQKILRLANTVQYRAVSGGQVTTVSRAIFLLGFETVKTTALAMLLVERLANLQHSHAVSAELKRAMCASVIGREMARCSRRPGSEEAAIAALFANVGQVMVAAYDYPHYAEILELKLSGKMSEEQAAIKVLGYGYGALSQSILRSWNIPESITHAIVPVSSGMLRPAKTAHEWLQQIASFSTEATQLFSLSQSKSAQAEDVLTARFGAALHFDRDNLQGLMKAVAREIAQLSTIMDLGELEKEIADPVAETPEQEIPEQFLMRAEEPLANLENRKMHPSGKPLRARELLLEGVQHLMEMSGAAQPRINDIMLLVLETLFNSMGFRFAAICLKDQKGSEFRARLALGEDLQRRKTGFTFTVHSKKDLFNLAMESDSDLMISDASDLKIRDLLPAWHRNLLPDAQSFMILPIVVNQKALGFFYGDRALPAPEGVPSDETALIRILKTQLVTSLSKR